MSSETQPPARTPRVILIIIGIGMIVSLYLIVTATSAYFQDPQSSAWQTNLLFGLLILGAIWVFNFWMRRRTKEIEWHTVSQIKCEQEVCEYSEIRDFKEGDYIYKKLGKCPACGGQDTLYIDLIYAYNPLEVKPQSTEIAQSA
ncbi:MAG: hypothetical protein KAI34_04260 [Candidatus Lokiarchaeota archaeon]|nr:hypothetical protein [Candidatus Lokiarchaeota archaeon]